MSIKAELRALVCGVVLACGAGRAQAATVSYWSDWLGSDFFPAHLLDNPATAYVLAVPGPVLGAGLPVLMIAFGIYLWRLRRRLIERHIVGPEVEPDSPEGMAYAFNQPLQAKDRLAVALVVLGVIATPAWMSLLVYAPGHLIGWW